MLTLREPAVNVAHMTQMDLLSESPAPAYGPYAWQQVKGVTCNTHWSLLEHGEPTRYWVRYRIRPSVTPWFIVTPMGLYPGDFASLRDAQEKVMSIKRGEHRF